MSLRLTAVLLLMSVGVVQAIETETVWRAPLEEAGKSSPRTVDLNADGMDDVVLGAGIEDRWGEAVALDGRTGDVLWRRRFPEEVLVTAPLLDVNGDGVTDVFVGGRTRLREVVALSGKDGSTIWGLAGANPQTLFPPLNFINLALVDDRDGDGLRDLLVVQSGGRDTLRLAARLHWVRSADGSLLSTTVLPDGKECYSIPLFDRRPGEKFDRLFLGTGGETLSGNLLRLRLPDLEETWRVPAIGAGFIGSPTLVDFDDDGRQDLVASSMNGAVYRVDPDTGSVRWRWRERPLWTYVSPAAGAFDEEPTLDVAAAFNRGAWPRSDGVLVVWIDGASGRTISRRSLDQRFGFIAASPLVLDVDHDGRDETMFVFTKTVLDPSAKEHSHALVLFDGGADREEIMRLELDGYSIATPRITDLDGNGKLDIIHAHRDGAMRIELRLPELPLVRVGELAP